APSTNEVMGTAVAPVQPAALAPLPRTTRHSPLTTHHSPLTTQQWGMLSFLVSEVALFGTLIVTYVFYLGRDVVGPTPADALKLGLVVWTTACLLASSGTVHVAERALGRGNRGGFLGWWLATIVLGAVFLGGTAFEWQELIYRYDLTISRNLFGTADYTLVGPHAPHRTRRAGPMLDRVRRSPR